MFWHVYTGYRGILYQTKYQANFENVQMTFLLLCILVKNSRPELTVIFVPYVFVFALKTAILFGRLEKKERK